MCTYIYIYGESIDPMRGKIYSVTEGFLLVKWLFHHRPITANFGPSMAQWRDPVVPLFFYLFWL